MGRIKKKLKRAYSHLKCSPFINAFFVVLVFLSIVITGYALSYMIATNTVHLIKYSINGNITGLYICIIKYPLFLLLSSVMLLGALTAELYLCLLLSRKMDK